jgi:hypothetical protein
MTPSNYPRDFLLLQARLVPGTPGLTRLQGTGTDIDFVDINQLDIVPGLGAFQLGQIAQVEVPGESRLGLSGYPSLASSLPVKGPIQRHFVRKNIQQILYPNPSFDYLASDGTVLTVNRDPSSGLITGFMGTGKDDHQYKLSIHTSVGMAPGRIEAISVSWLYAVVFIQKDEDTPLMFGFAYCPWNNLMNVFLSKDTTVATTPVSVLNNIRIDLAPYDPKAAEQNVSLSRSFTFFEYTYVAQSLTMDDSASDPPFYLPAKATLWPFLDRVEFFAPALAKVAAEIGVTPLPFATPLLSLVSYSLNFPISSADFISQVGAMVGPAIGPFLAGFVSPTELEVAGLISAAQWLGWALTTGTGHQDFLKELSAYYTAADTWWARQEPSRPSHSLPKYLPVTPQTYGNTIEGYELVKALQGLEKFFGYI